MSEEHGLNLEVIQEGEWLNHILVHAADAAFNKMNVHHMFFLLNGLEAMVMR